MSQAEIQRLLVEAQSAIQHGDRTAARITLEKVLSHDPANPHALNSIGIQALEDGRFSEAESLFKRATAADPNEPELWLNVANAQRQQANSAGELESLEAALALNQTHFMAVLRKAQLLERTSKHADAMEAWGGVVTLAAQASHLPPPIADAVAHGQTYLADHQRRLGATLDESLTSARDGLSELELRRFNACADASIGRRRIYKNECHGIHFPFLPADEFFDDAHFPWMAEIEARTDAIRAELLSLLADEAPNLQPYVQQKPGTPANIWSELDGTLDWGAYFLWNYGERIDEACARCPETAKALDLVPRCDLPNRAPTAFFSLLQPKKHIPPHTGVTNVRAIVHLPLIAPPDCAFRVGGETRPWVEGKAFAFDDTIEHEAWNDSDEFRAVLIFDVWNPHIAPHERTLLQQMCATIDASGYQPSASEWR